MKNLTTLIVFLISVPAYAHHSSATNFDNNAEISLTGVVTNFDWKNPHIEIFIDVEDADGNVVNWVLPTAAPVVASRIGITPETVVPGNTIVVSGWPARDGSNAMRAWVMTLEDGTSFQLSPGGARGVDSTQRPEGVDSTQQQGGVRSTQVQAAMAKRLSGETLTAEEEVLLKEFRRDRVQPPEGVDSTQQPGGIVGRQVQAALRKRISGEPLTAEEEALLEKFQPLGRDGVGN
jgi:hypothetical protein